MGALMPCRRACNAVVNEEDSARAGAFGQGQKSSQNESLSGRIAEFYESAGGALPPRTTRKGSFGADTRVSRGARVDGGVSNDDAQCDFEHRACGTAKSSKPRGNEPRSDDSGEKVSESHARAHTGHVPENRVVERPARAVLCNDRCVMVTRVAVGKLGGRRSMHARVMGRGDEAQRDMCSELSENPRTQ